MNGPISPETMLTVTLEARQWDVVLAGVSELKLKDVLPLWQTLMGQLQGTAQTSNGVDANPPAQFSGDHPLPA
jgi:hypothetical protein